MQFHIMQASMQVQHDMLYKSVYSLIHNYQTNTFQVELDSTRVNTLLNSGRTQNLVLCMKKGYSWEQGNI